MGEAERAPRCAMPRLYAIVDRETAGARPPDELARALAAAGVRLIQYRDKQGASREIFAACERMRKALEPTGCIFIVNDRTDIARAVGASGAHVGQDDLPAEPARRVLLPGQWLGVSTHRLEEASEAEASPADYVAFGPIFPTATQRRPHPVVGLEGLRRVRRVVTKPLVAIGGITLANAPSAIEAGADAVAVIRDLTAGPDIARRAEEFLRLLNS